MSPARRLQRKPRPTGEDGVARGRQLRDQQQACEDFLQEQSERKDREHGRQLRRLRDEAAGPLPVEEGRRRLAVAIKEFLRLQKPEKRAIAIDFGGGKTQFAI